jgi:hypothetical protein
MLVALDGSWFERGLRARVDLTRRPLLRRLFHALLQQRRAATGVPLSRASLLAAGWPGERIDHEVGRNRLHVALRQLRVLGLEGVLLHANQGYLLDAAAEILCVEAHHGGRERRGAPARAELAHIFRPDARPGVSEHPLANIEPARTECS